MTHFSGYFKIFSMKIALTGGGTLGHVYPALAVAEALKKIDKDIELFYISTTKENEIEIINKYGIKDYPITGGKLRRYFSFENFIDLFRTIKGYFQAKKILKKERPDILFSKGGYLSVPVVRAAHRLKIKVCTHESDSTLGLATRLNAKVSKRVFLGFDMETVDDKKYIFTGNPVRLDIQNAKPVETSRPLILVLGGSQGAQEVNEVITANLKELTELGYVYHQTGKLWDKHIDNKDYTQTEFIKDEMGTLLKSATLVISRSGAGAISEIMYCRKPMILLPLGTAASRGDQIINAEYVENKGLGVILRDKSELVSLVKRFIEDKSYHDSFLANYDNMTYTDPALAIAKQILALR